ncbi:MAG: hypothetical protein RTU92_10365 [Candidatus Thorarchaeota archaeon]
MIGIGQGLVLFSILALLRSFAELHVGEGETLLREDLVPNSQTESQYLDQLIHLVKKKQENISGVKQLIGGGLLWVMLVFTLDFSNVLYALQLTNDILLASVTSTSLILYLGVCFYFTVIVIAMLGLLGVETTD